MGEINENSENSNRVLKCTNAQTSDKRCSSTIDKGKTMSKRTIESYAPSIKVAESLNVSSMNLH